MKISPKPLTIGAEWTIITVYGIDGIDRYRHGAERERKVRAPACGAGAAPEPLRETGACSALRRMRKGQLVLLNLGGTTKAFVPFGGGGVFI